MAALNLAIVADDEPVAAEPVLDRASIDRRDINRKAVKFWPLIRDFVVDRNGRSMICHLNPAFVPTDPNRGRPYGVPDPRPQLREFRGPMPWLNGVEGGAWVDYGTGKSGPDCISIIEMLGNCDRKTATTFLRDLVDRCAEIAK
jgi:hypothetical protein